MSVALLAHGKNVRILYLVHQYFPRHVGGTEDYVHGLATSARDAGHCVRVVTAVESPDPDPEAFHVERLRHDGIEVVETHFNLSVTDHPAKCEYDNPFPQRVVTDEIRSFAPTVIHVAHPMKLSGSVFRACRQSGAPIILTLCDFWLVCPLHTLLRSDGKPCTESVAGSTKCVSCLQQAHGFARSSPAKHPTRWAGDLLAIRYRNVRLRRLALSAQRILALSKSLKAAFVQRGYPADRIEVVDKGINVPTPAKVANGHRQTSPNKPLRVGFIGNLVAHKGLDVLLRALALVPELAVECRVHGPLRQGDPYSERIRSLAARDRRVCFAGEFTSDKLGRLLEELDVLAVPSQWHENNPYVVQGALGLGTPVLASRLGSLEEMLSHRGTEWLVAPQEPRAWAEALRRLAASPPDRFAPKPQPTVAEHSQHMLEIYAAEQERGPCLNERTCWTIWPWRASRLRHTPIPVSNR